MNIYKTISRRKIITTTTALIAATPVLKLSNTHAAPKAQLWSHFNQSGKQNIPDAINQPWSNFLKKYIITNQNNINLIAYKNVAESDHNTLKKYINTLSEQPVRSLNPISQMCLWINLYNALTIDVILDHYPVATIRDIDISPGFFADGPWGKKLVRIEQQDVSLDDIEHRILRPIWKDPKIHYAVNCASIGCPNLQKQPFTPKNATRLLNKGAQDFINHKRGAHIVNGNLIVSSIYDWFKQDFGTTDANIIDHIKNYAKPKLKADLNTVNAIYDHQYDWAINAA